MTLFASWKTWAEQSAQFVGDAKTFRARLELHNDIEHKAESGTKRAGFKGVRLKPAGHYGDYAQDSFD